MTISLTFKPAGNGRFCRADTRLSRVSAWTAILASAVLVAFAAPASACDKAATLVATGSGATRGVATFTGEFVNGAPIYRLPAIVVVGRRPANVANTQRGDGARRNGPTRGDAAAAGPAPSRVANAADDVNVLKPCVG